MPGIYLHIPFCKKACHYCNFHFSTSLQSKGALLAALHRELEMQSGYLDGQPLGSVYLGGGTPSLLDTAELAALFETIHLYYKVSADAEVTLEANPDDLNADKIADLKNHTPVNRLSIGIQSFREEDLVWMNRAHHATESVQCLERVVGAGFTDWTADLIYGLPESNDDVWASNVQQLLDFGAPHLSAYCLTVEQGTALHHFVQKGQSRPVDEQQALQQFEYLMDTLAGRGYEHYEISNFALPGRYARHNSRYWLGDSYLGVGPSAHSFDGHSRQWNVSNNARYIKSIENGLVPFEKELITPTMRYNEYVMTRMRTHWGCQLADIQALGAVFAGHFEHEIVPLQKKGLVEKAGSGAWKLTQAGKFQADGVSASLFWVV